MLMSKSQYAKHRGVSRQTVYDWIARGEVVLSGSKIDVGATEQKASTPTSDSWPHRTLQMTWSECWEEIKSKDGQYPAPDNDKGLMKAVEAAADELGYEVELLEDGGIYLDTQDADFYFQRYDLKENASLLLMTLRRELYYTATEFPDEEAEWSPEGIRALSIWQG